MATRSRELFWFVGALVAVIISWRAPAQAQEAPPSSQPCFAYLWDGDIHVHCWGKSQRITTGHDIYDFAAAHDGRTLAVMRLRGNHVLQVFSLKSGQPQLDRVLSQGDTSSGLFASCGTIIFVSRFGENREDLLAEKPLSIAPYWGFACSADRRTVVGSLKGEPRRLRVGLPPTETIAEDAGTADVSPNGRFVAYRQPESQLCLKNLQGGTRCVSGWREVFGLAVSDSGSVIFSSYTEQGCFYRYTRSSTVAQPGYDGDACKGLYAWDSDIKEPELIEPLGETPQWISPETAAALRSWGKKITAPRPQRRSP